ncbi:DivIVA domain-containing protein [Arcicella sp. LKC2W]|uniref:DivIVA domain-containing protein n=1 Tax=Arcicella sp. LKC2W TaxID=2984198 RepID=UPI002B21D42F|nr:DivIVA domain-containing protein [Arcicella sp. LKC2W]MEA5458625.1 DivIVA domain-containing protein [Arcicella sp. LKC2W]
MRITPLEIRQHTFDKSFRGYDTESVDAFLLSLSQEWERVSEELRQSKQQLEVAEREIVRMKEIENSLFKTLKAAEDAQQEINAKAQAEADLITDKAKKDAEEITAEAQKGADMVISEAESKAKFLVEDAVNDLKNYERDFKAMERYKDYLVVELKSFANDALDKVTKFEERINSRTNEARLNDLDIKIAEKKAEIVAPVPVVVAQETPIEEIVQEAEENTIIEQNVVSAQNQETIIAVSSVVEEHKPVIIEAVKEPEIDFEPASDFDDEDAELPTVHAILSEEENVELPTVNTILNEDVELPTVNAILGEEQHSDFPSLPFNEIADNLTREMKAARGRPRKTSKDDNLPTVSSVMEEFAKESPAAISNGGGSFFDNI